MQLTEAQKEAINEIDHNLQIIACAGSGKTEVITRRIAHILSSRGDVAPESIVGFTFTNKAAENMRERIKRVYGSKGTKDIRGMYLGTIHAFCKRLLIEFSDDYEDFSILDTVREHLFISRYHKECGAELLGLTRDREAGLFVSCIEKMIDDFDNRDTWSDDVRTAFESYRGCLIQHKYLDFAMLIHEALQQIRNNPKVQEYINSIKYLIVDEYQDVDDLQEMIIREIASCGANVCVVGDDDQTIYQFRGSNADNMIEFGRHYNNVRQIRMETNYRCVKEVVSVADTVIGNNQNRLPKRMRSGREDSGFVEVRDFSDVESEYSSIARRISILHQGGKQYSSFAILIRKRKLLNELCRVLSKNGIPYHADSTDEFFEGEYLPAYLSILEFANSFDREEFYNIWNEYLDDEHFIRGFKQLKREARSGGTAAHKPLSGLIDRFVENTDFMNIDDDSMSKKIRDKECFNKILNDIDEIYADQQFSARIAKAVKFIENNAADEYRSFETSETEDTDAVQIMTVHKSKGLEFEMVFIPDLIKGMFPARKIGGRQYWHILGEPFIENKAKYEGTEEDERKLFYVATTRAKNRLYLMFETSKREVSKFVVEACKSPYIDFDIERVLPKKKESRGGANHWTEDDDSQEPRYRLNKKALKASILDYYGTGAHFNRLAGADLVRVSSMWDDEDLILEARKIGLNINKYIDQVR